MGCASLNKLSNSENEKWKPEFRVLAGINQGGIIENTDLSEIEGIKIDAFTGATTKLGYNAGVHTLLPVFKNNVEIGVDYMHNNQTFKFNDNVNSYFGSRALATNQVLIPFTYNIGVLRKKHTEGLFQIKLGYVLQFNSYNISEWGTNLPEYSTNNFSNGITMGIATTPFKFKNGNSIGLYLDAYRGSQIYDDFYNQSTFEMPGSSYFKTGLIYHFKKK